MDDVALASAAARPGVALAKTRMQLGSQQVAIHDILSSCSWALVKRKVSPWRFDLTYSTYSPIRWDGSGSKFNKLVQKAKLCMSMYVARGIDLALLSDHPRRMQSVISVTHGLYSNSCFCTSRARSGKDSKKIGGYTL